MGIARGTNIVRDGLVFGLDSGYGVADPGVSTRFYKGKPTTNIASGAALIHDTAGGGAGSVVDAPEKGPGWKKVTITAIGTNFRVIQFGSYPTMTSGVTYSSSFEADWGNMRGKGYYITQDGSGGGDRNYFKNGDYATGSTNVVEINSGLVDGHIGMNITRTGTHVHVPFIYNGNTSTTGRNDYFYYKEYQQEVGTIPTPYVNSTRSDTASLIDLKRTKSIDVSNISFDSTGQPDFDGTNDYVNITSYTQHQSPTGTIEAVVKPTNNGGNRYAFGVGGTSTYGASRALRIYSGNWSVVGYGSGGPTAQDWNDIVTATTDWQHVVITWSDTTYCFYLDGVKYTANRAGTVTPTGSVLRIGAPPFATDANFIGSIASVKCYNVVLTQAQVTQNFNAYKNRFNI